MRDPEEKKAGLMKFFEQYLDRMDPDDISSSIGVTFVIVGAEFKNGVATGADTWAKIATVGNPEATNIVRLAVANCVEKWVQNELKEEDPILPRVTN